MDDEQKAQRRLIQRLLNYTQTDATNLARLAGVAHTTLTRFLNKEGDQLLSNRTIAKLMRASGLPPNLEDPAWLSGPESPPHAYPQRRGHLVNTADERALLMLWKGLSTPEKMAVLDYIEQLRTSPKTGAA